ALVAIGKDLVGLLGLLELLLCRGIVRTAVRMAFHREAAERLLEVFLARAAFDAQHLVVAALAHGNAGRKKTGFESRCMVVSRREREPVIGSRSSESRIPNHESRSYFLSSLTSVNSAS